MALTPEMLSQLFGFLLKRSNEAHARAEAMRLLLQRHDAFSQPEFQKLYDQLVAATTQRTAALIDHLESAEHDEVIRQLLRDFEGPTQ